MTDLSIRIRALRWSGLTSRLRRFVPALLTNLSQIVNNESVHELGAGWREYSLVRGAPDGGVVEWQVRGLQGEEVRLFIDDDMTETKVQPRDLARAARPVQRGRHRIGVQWRGEVRRPSGFWTRFHHIPRTLAELEHDAPEVAAVMKKNNPQGFVVCDALVVTQPQGQSCQVYGIFTVDRKQLRSGQRGASIVKQDFLVHDRNADPEEITYYTGFKAPGPHRPIEDLCERFGAPNFGCEQIRGRWRCRDHHYSLDELDRLPTEHGFRQAIDLAIEIARREG